MPAIGFLSNGSPGTFSHIIAALRSGLNETGHIDGKNVMIEFRYAEGRADQLPGFAADFVGRNVALIVATGGFATWLPAKAATATIPIIFTGGSDPVKLGLLASLGRPGGNATGVATQSAELSKKRLQLLRELVPAARVISVLFNIANAPNANEQVRDLQATARAIGQQIEIVNARSEREIDAVFAEMACKRAGALLVDPSGFVLSRRTQLVALAARHSIPAGYAFPEYVDAGGLMSYGVNLADVHRQAGVYAGRILKARNRRIFRSCSRLRSSWRSTPGSRGPSAL
jgi:putative ABC transport system substrate-binding protein